MPQMQVVAGTVGTLPGLVSDRKDLEGPALVLMGECIALRSKLMVAADAPPPVAASSPLAASPDDAPIATIQALLAGLTDESLRAARDH